MCVWCVYVSVCLGVFGCVCVYLWTEPANILEPARNLRPHDLSERAQSAKGQLIGQTSTAAQTVHQEERGRHFKNYPLGEAKKPHHHQQQQKNREKQT